MYAAGPPVGGRRAQPPQKRGGDDDAKKNLFQPPGPRPIPSRPGMRYPVQGNPSLPLLHCHLGWFGSSGE